MAVGAGALDRVSAVLVRLAVLAAGVLVVTGVPLVVLYRPEGGAQWLRTLHSLASTLFLGAAAAVLLVAVVAVMLRRRTWPGWPLALAGFAIAAAASVTGQLIAWDLLALPDVAQVGSPQGVIDPLTEDIRFLVVGTNEVSPATYIWWTIVHLLVLPTLAVVVGRVLWRRMRDSEAVHRAAAEGGEARSDDAHGITDGPPETSSGPPPPSALDPGDSQPV